MPEDKPLFSPIDGKMLNEPLLNEDGQINERCMEELAKALEDMPRIYERSEFDPEWANPRWTGKTEITGELAKWAIRQSPYACPDNLREVVEYLDSQLEQRFEWLSDVKICLLSLNDIAKALYEILYIPEYPLFQQWNIRKSPQEDFIDLDALLINVCIGIRTSRREHDEFDLQFEDEHGPLGGAQ